MSRLSLGRLQSLKGHQKNVIVFSVGSLALRPPISQQVLLAIKKYTLASTAPSFEDRLRAGTSRALLQCPSGTAQAMGLRFTIEVHLPPALLACSPGEVFFWKQAEKNRGQNYYQKRIGKLILEAVQFFDRCKSTLHLAKKRSQNITK